MANVGVLGPAQAQAAELTDAYAVGRALAEAGHVVLCGGLGGVMREAARGATDAGGTAVGLLPGDDPADGDEHLSVALPTGLGEARNALLVRSCAGFVAVGGSWGTLSEVALAVRTGRPVAWLHAWSVTGAGAGSEHLAVLSSPAEAVGWVAGRLG